METAAAVEIGIGGLRRLLLDDFHKLLGKASAKNRSGFSTVSTIQGAPALLEFGGVDFGEVIFGIALQVNDAKLDVAPAAIPPFHFFLIKNFKDPRHKIQATPAWWRLWPKGYRPGR